MAEFNINITNGKGSAKIPAGSYLAVVDAPGFDNGSLLPIMVNLPNQSTTTALTISAKGTLTIIFNETGEESGQRIISGAVVMTDATGQTQYGSIVNINSNGEAVFENVPFGSIENGYELYFVQLSTDDNHRINQSAFSVVMEVSNKTHHVKNEALIEQHFTVQSVDYENMVLNNATLTLK